jgi:prophage regulatory protein
MGHKPITETRPSRLIRLKEVLRLIPISRSTWWDGVRSGRYPAPVKLGPRLTCWRLHDVLELSKRAAGEPRCRQ